MAPRSARRRQPDALAAAVAAATEELAGRHPELARLVAAAGPCGLAVRRELTHFGSLCRSITFQQLAGKAAAYFIAERRSLAACAASDLG